MISMIEQTGNRIDIYAVIGALIVLLLKEIYTKWKSDRKNETIQELNREKIATIEANQNRFEDILVKHVNSDSFRRKFRNLVSKFTISKVTNSELLSNEIYSKAITDFSENIAEFALKFFYSDVRISQDQSKNDKILTFKTDIDSIFHDFLALIKSEIKAEKAFIINLNTYKVTLHGLIVLKSDNKAFKIPGLMQLNDLIIERFAQNGITEEDPEKKKDLTSIVINYLDQFIQKFKDTVIEFNCLEDYDKVIEKKMDKDVF